MRTQQNQGSVLTYVDSLSGTADGSDSLRHALQGAVGFC